LRAGLERPIGLKRLAKLDFRRRRCCGRMDRRHWRRRSRSSDRLAAAGV